MDRTEAVQLLRRLHEAQQAFYTGGDDAPVRALLADDVHWHVPGRNAIAGDYRGIDTVLAYFRRRRDLVDVTFRMHPGDVLVGDSDRVAALTDGTAVVGGIQRRWSTVGLYQIRDGRIAGYWLLPLDPANFDDIWSGLPGDLAGHDRKLSRWGIVPGSIDQPREVLHIERKFDYTWGRHGVSSSTVGDAISDGDAHRWCSYDRGTTDDCSAAVGLCRPVVSHCWSSGIA